MWACVGGAVLAVIGLAASQPLIFGVAALGLIGTVVTIMMISVSTSPAILEFNALKSECERAHARLHGDSLDPEYRSTLDTMIACDEGTLAYCAAKIASEIQRQVASQSSKLEVIAIDLWDELDAIVTPAHARSPKTAREPTNLSAAGSAISARSEKRSTRTAGYGSAAIALLAARVYAFADYRDRLHLLGTAAWRDARITSRAMRLTSDELAANELR